MQMLTQLQERKLAFVRAHARWMGIDLIATGNQLCAQRRKHHLSQEFLSELFDAVGDSASRIAISNWENGKKLPSLKHVVFLSVLYGCSLDELVVSTRRSREAEDRDQPVLFLFHLNIVIMR